MRKKIFTLIALVFTFTWAISSFAQGYDDLWWQHEYNQIIIKRIEEKDAYKQSRHTQSLMDVNGNCQNGFRDNGTKKEAQAYRNFIKKIYNGIKRGWNFCVAVCTGTYKPTPLET